MCTGVIDTLDRDVPEGGRTASQVARDEGAGMPGVLLTGLERVYQGDGKHGPVRLRRRARGRDPRHPRDDQRHPDRRPHGGDRYTPAGTVPGTGRR
ncbi:hypothetical protein GCM10010214_02340 [Streptomyces abikoensis]|nr:hypothetical protein GCM10010214_02340 [Streptomyces abikoensis]